MRSWRKSTLALMGLFAACSNSPAVSEEVHAVLVQGTDESRAELQRVVSEAMYDVPLLLAKDALTESSLLVIEPSPPSGIEQRPLRGRDLNMPIQFRLWRIDGQCWLERMDNKKRWLLTLADCVPET